MYILLHSKDLPRGEYGFQITHMLGRNGRYDKPSVIDCGSARQAMSYANGLVEGWLSATSRTPGWKVPPILKTPTFEAQLAAEFQEEGA